MYQIDVPSDQNSDISISTYQQYIRMNKYHDYLQYNEKNIYRDLTTPYCGLKNLGNTCYFNVILQILYSINYLRNDLVLAYNGSNRFLKQLKKLFGFMSKGEFFFADPSELFQQSVKSKSDLFKLGVQCDFYQVLSFFIDQLEKSFTDTQLKKITKIFIGKIKNKIKISKDSSSKIQNIIKMKDVKFNVINLNCIYEDFKSALDAFRFDQITQYQSEDGKIEKATTENIFVQTPDMMIFFISRVSYKEGSPVKNSIPFYYENKIFFSKRNSASTTNAQQQIQKIQQQNKKIQQHIHKIKRNKQKISATIQYLKSKQYSINQGDQKVKQQYYITRNYLNKELEQMQIKIKQYQEYISKKQASKIKIACQNDSQLYELFAIMIHSGKSAVSGHYKVCINTNDNVWVQFNDKKASKIDQKRIKKYHENGQICCLFYKRESLIVDTHIAISQSLKKQILQSQNQLKKNIDKARIQQIISSKKQQMSQILKIQQTYLEEYPYLYFLKPVKYLIQSKKSNLACINALLSEEFSEQSLKVSLKQKLFFKQNMKYIPKFQFQLPNEYTSIQKGLKKFLEKQLNFQIITEAYQDFFDLIKIKIKSQKIISKFEVISTLLFIKGVFYYLLSDYYNFRNTDLLDILIKIYNKINEDRAFLLNYFDVLLGKEKLKFKENKNTKIKKNHQHSITNYCVLLENRFRPWIQILNKVNSMTKKQIYQHCSMHYKQYIEEES